MSTPALWSGAAVALLISGCVITTFEGPSEPPRVTAPPSAVPAGLAPAANEPSTIGARHLLVSYRGSRMAGPEVTRTKAEAQQRAEEALSKARAGEDFPALVAQYSDEPGAAERGGDLGTFSREQMVRRFSDAAFALPPGGISAVVETEFGFHVIQRTR